MAGDEQTGGPLDFRRRNHFGQWTDGRHFFGVVFAMAVRYKCDMNFTFNAAKATEAACRLIEKEGQTINILKLVKLVYLLDQFSIQRRGIPVVGGAYVSMRNGPVTSELPRFQFTRWCGFRCFANDWGRDRKKWASAQVGSLHDDLRLTDLGGVSPMCHFHVADHLLHRNSAQHET